MYNQKHIKEICESCFGDKLEIVQVEVDENSREAVIKYKSKPRLKAIKQDINTDFYRKIRSLV